MQYRADRGDGAASANRCARGDQIRSIATDLQKLAERQSNYQRKRNSQRSVNKSAAPSFDNLVQVHSEPQCHHGHLEQDPCRASAEMWIRMPNAEPENNSQTQRYGRRDPAAQT